MVCYDGAAAITRRVRPILVLPRCDGQGKEPALTAGAKDFSRAVRSTEVLLRIKSLLAPVPVPELERQNRSLEQIVAERTERCSR